MVHATRSRIHSTSSFQLSLFIVFVGRGVEVTPVFWARHGIQGPGVFLYTVCKGECIRVRGRVGFCICSRRQKTNSHLAWPRTRVHTRPTPPAELPCESTDS
ncbi:unnamed protein product [Ectocarpus sp. 12 AP-2014]